MSSMKASQSKFLTEETSKNVFLNWHMENILKVLLNRLWKALDLPTCSCRGTILIEKPLSIVVVPVPKSYRVKITFQIFEIRCENLCLSGQN